MNAKSLGWIVAAALLAVAAAAGFQGSTKIGVVDATKVFNDSDYAKTQLDVLKAFVQARQDMLQFVDSYRAFTGEQATKYHDLSLKPTRTTAEQAELDGIKKAVMASDARLKELQQKQNPTAAESTELTDLTNRTRTTVDTAQRWSRDAQDECDNKKQELNKAGLDLVKNAIKQVASGQGFTIVYLSDVAPYGANDITTDVLKVMNKK